MKYLIVGLGNIGSEYEDTRHNIGFMVLDRLVKGTDCKFEIQRHAYTAEMRHKGRTLLLIKPTTYMNLSGKALNYWMKTEKIPIENVLVIVDDIALPVGTIRIKKKGSAGGHNGLGNIEETLGHSDYARLRFGIGDNFSRGRQIDYVLGKFSTEELITIDPQIDKACEAIKTFATMGIDRTMNFFNNK
ncbi:MAG: aminoacyl-tRNA hydrolase [Bacteroidales bacterium]|nr:aminoacyl-tRNA hydrolase [Bacteroidales bacterium]